MLSILLIAGIFLASGYFHYWAMRMSMDGVNRIPIGHGGKLVLALALMGLAHVIEAGFYAGGFFFGREWGIGAFKPEDPQNFMDIYYFSIVNYTSLGLGDIYPSGHLRLMAGVEALNGFLLISCSASFLFLHIQRGMKTEQG